MQQSKTTRDGFVVMTLHIKEDERMKRLRERREQKEQQKANDEQERLRRKAKHDKKIKAKEQNKPEEVIEKEEQKQRKYDEQQDDTESANIIVEEGLYRLNIEVTVKNKYDKDETFELKDENQMFEESEITDDLVLDIFEFVKENLQDNENFDDSVKEKEIDENDIQYIRNYIIEKWRNNEVPKIRLG